MADVTMWPSAAVLIGRAQRVAGLREDALVAAPAPAVDPRLQHIAQLEEFALRLHDAYHAVIPPVLSNGGGPKHRVAFYLKKVVRKLTAWYVEPRWAVQREQNAEVARFATAAVATARAMHAQLVVAERAIEQSQSAQARQTRLLASNARRADEMAARIEALETDGSAS